MALWLDDGFDSWPEVIRSGNAAAGLYGRCGAWIARNTTDGHIPAEVAVMYDPGGQDVSRLVDVGLWQRVDGGFYDTRYLDLNPDAATVRKRRAAAAARQRRSRDRRADTGESRVTGAVSHTTPALPNPVPSLREGGGRGTRTGTEPHLRSVPQWCGYCYRDTRRVVDDDNRWQNCPTCHPDRLPEQVA